jgi:retinol dehydrogenase 12
VPNIEIVVVLNVLFARALASHLLPGSSLIVNAANPGYCYSNLRRNSPFLARIFFDIMDFLFARPTEVGSSILVWAALAGHGDKRDDNLINRLRGAYVSDWKVMEASDFVLSEQGASCQQQIWVSPCSQMFMSGSSHLILCTGGDD